MVEAPSDSDVQQSWAPTLAAPKVELKLLKVRYTATLTWPVPHLLYYFSCGPMPTTLSNEPVPLPGWVVILGLHLLFLLRGLPPLPGWFPHPAPQ